MKYHNNSVANRIKFLAMVDLVLWVQAWDVSTRTKKLKDIKAKRGENEVTDLFMVNTGVIAMRKFSNINTKYLSNFNYETSLTTLIKYIQQLKMIEKFNKSEIQQAHLEIANTYLLKGTKN